MPWFNSDGPLKSEVSHSFLIFFHFSSSRLNSWFVNSSWSITVTLKKRLALYVPWFNSDGPLKSEVSYINKHKFVQKVAKKMLLLISFKSSTSISSVH